MEPNQQIPQVVMQQPKIPTNAMMPSGDVKLPKDKHTALIIAVTMSVLFVLTLVFAIWAFVGKVSNQTNLDKKIDIASSAAVEEAEAAKEVEFTEREKSPYKTYIGSSTFGSLQFDYPKSWSVYLEEADKGTVLDYYAHPDVVPGLKSTTTAYAFRAQIVSVAYDQQVKTYEKLAAAGSVTITAFRPAKLPDQLGVKIVGEIAKGKQGELVLLPQRDKTFVIWTESNDYIPDFEKVIETITFVP